MDLKDLTEMNAEAGNRGTKYAEGICGLDLNTRNIVVNAYAAGFIQAVKVIEDCEDIECDLEQPKQP